MHLRARKPRLRAPFVVTFAAAAAAAAVGACGGRVEGVIGDEAIPKATSNPPVVVDAGGCPPEMPASGACNLPKGVICNYGNCEGAPTGFASCVNGAWTFGGESCNPPPPPPEGCPTVEPAAGGACVVASGVSCTYHANECDAAHGYLAERTYACIGSVWQGTSAASCNPPRLCPTDTPQPGAACYASGLKCDYGSCYGTPTIEATCDGGTWHVMNAGCNPPAPDAGLTDQ